MKTSIPITTTIIIEYLMRESCKNACIETESFVNSPSKIKPPIMALIGYNLKTLTSEIIDLGNTGFCETNLIVAKLF